MTRALELFLSSAEPWDPQNVDLLGSGLRSAEEEKLHDIRNFSATTTSTVDDTEYHVSGNIIYDKSELARRLMTQVKIASHEPPAVRTIAHVDTKTNEIEIDAGTPRTFTPKERHSAVTP